MKIAVCEDDSRDRERLCAQLGRAMEDLAVQAELVEFDTAEDLLQAAESTYFSAFFLDILLPGLSGMDAALKLRRKGNHSPVVFTTVTRDYLAQSYSVWAAHYLVKPIADKDVREALSRALHVLERGEKTLSVTVSRHTEYIPYSDIYYIQGNDQTTLVHTRTGVYNPYRSVQSILKSLSADGRFYRSHRSYVVNLDHVLAVQQDKVAMRDDALLPVRRGGTKALRTAWEDRRFAVVDGRG